MLPSKHPIATVFKHRFTKKHYIIVFIGYIFAVAVKFLCAFSIMGTVFVIK